MNYYRRGRGTALAIAFRAFRYRNYRLFFFGQGISLIGTWMQSVATSWLVYRITGSPLALGIVAFAGQVPVFLLSPVAGVLNDRWNGQRLLVTVQFLAMSQSLILASITFTGYAAFWNIVALTAILGLINSFEMPTRQALVIDLIDDKNDLGNAIALNSALFNGTRLVGPALAGVLVALVGEKFCFLINAVSYFAAIWAFSSMKITPRERDRRELDLLGEMKEGVLYALRFTPIRDILLLIALISLVGMSFPVVLPVFAVKILGGGSGAYGALVAFSGLGATAGTIFLALRKNVHGLDSVITAGMFIFGLSLVAFSFSKSFYLSLGLIAVVGFGMIINIASCNTIIQTVVDEDKRGRILSLYIMSFMGTAPLGSLLAGSLSKWFGAPAAALTGGIIAVAGGLFFASRLGSIRRLVGPVYREKGYTEDLSRGVGVEADFGNTREYAGD